MGEQAINARRYGGRSSLDTQVGHYIRWGIGSWRGWFVCIEEEARAAVSLLAAAGAQVETGAGDVGRHPILRERAKTVAISSFFQVLAHEERHRPAWASDTHTRMLDFVNFLDRQLGRWRYSRCIKGFNDARTQETSSTIG